MEQLSLNFEHFLPSLVVVAHERTQRRIFEFFISQLPNDNTRKAYTQAITQFAQWLAPMGASIETATPEIVALYLQWSLKKREPIVSLPTIKQHLCALSRMYEFLKDDDIVTKNPVAGVKRPRYTVTRGKTPDFSNEEIRAVIECIDASTLIGSRDRALMGVMLYSFARVSAALALDLGDYFAKGRQMWLRLHEKRGKIHEVPVHHKLEEYLDCYLDRGGLHRDEKGPIFRGIKVNRFSEHRLTRSKAWERVRIYCARARVEEKFGCHSYRATGITAHLKNGGSLDQAQRIAAHSSISTTRLYDRRKDEVAVEEIERIRV
jgi:site-specific recombinase XerD